MAEGRCFHHCQPRKARSEDQNQLDEHDVRGEQLWSAKDFHLVGKQELAVAPRLSLWCQASKGNCWVGGVRREQ